MNSEQELQKKNVGFFEDHMKSILWGKLLGKVS